jgi:filamentous hemagglutinin family protein
MREIPLCFFLLACSRLCFAEGGIATDGSLGSAQTLSGVHVMIPQTLGQTSGANLFHSFSEFNVNVGQTVTVTGVNTLQNVISRVTGGAVSNINGILESKAGKADFYLINPAGVVFGKSAQIDMPASFHVSAADYLRFKDGGVYKASYADGSTLSIAPPEAFGFKGGQAADIRFEGNGAFQDTANRKNWQGTRLNWPASQTFDVVAGNISIDKTALVSAGAGVLRLIAQQGAGELRIGAPLTQPSGGVIKIIDSWLETSGDGGGALLMRAHALRALNSVLYADNHGDADAAQGISLRADLMLLDNSMLTADAIEGNGRGGVVDIAVKHGLDIQNGAQVHASTERQADAGGVAIRAGQLTLDGQGSDAITGIASRAEDASSGNAGQVTIKVAGSMAVLRGGLISTATLGKGKAGAVEVKAGRLLLEGSESAISARALENSSGDGGRVTVKVGGELQVLNHAVIGAGTAGAGNAGDVRIQASQIEVGRQAIIGSGVAEGATGRSGSVFIRTPGTLHLYQLGGVSVEDFGTGQSAADSMRPRIHIEAGRLLADSVGYISATADNRPSASISLRIAEFLHLRDSIVTTSSNNNNGGSIAIQTPALLLETGTIKANSVAGERGGTIGIQADALLASGSSLLLNPFLRLPFQPGVFGFNVIQSAAPNGISGVVNLPPPQLNLSGVLAHLGAAVFDSSLLRHDYCDLWDESSFILQGKGALPRRSRELVLY